MKKITLLLIILSFGTFSFAQTGGEDYVFFDDSPTTTSYDPSWGFVESPSELKRVGEKFPVDSDIFFQGNNSLRLHWTSRAGGDWGIAVAEPGWVGHDVTQRDTLTFWVFSDSLIQDDHMPLIYLEDLNNQKTEKMSLTSYTSDITDSQWTQIKVPLRIFDDAAQNADLTQIKTIFYGQDVADSIEHTLWLDEIRMYIGNPTDTTAPAIPAGLTAEGYDSHVTVSWEPNTDDDLMGYKISRSRNGGVFTQVGYVGKEFHHFADFLGEPGVNATYKIKAVDENYNESEFTGEISTSTEAMTEEEILTMVQEATFRYFWDYAHPISGLTRERIPVSENLVTIGGSGFGVMAIMVGIERGFITRTQGADRLLQIVNFLETADRFHGAWPHWMNGTTGEVIPFSSQDDGGDLVETAFMIQGLLAARQYFDGSGDTESQIRTQITSLWESVEWEWYRQSENSDVLYWHWSPNYEWAMDFPLRGWNETMITYLLAIASPTHGIPASMYHDGWAGNVDYENNESFYGYELYVGNGTAGPLFFTHYSFLGFDPRYKKDDYANYFKHNRNQTLVNRAWCIENPGGYDGYDENTWGLTASEDPFGYLAHEPSSGRDNGTITPTAALSSMPYTPDESKAAMMNFYHNYGDDIWGGLGFKDAFNPTEDWVSASYLAIDQGPIIAMIENYRSQLIWDNFMANPEIQSMLDDIGFVPDSSEVGLADDPTQPHRFQLIGNYPNPFNTKTTIAFELPQKQNVTVEILDIRGQTVDRIELRKADAGYHEVQWQGQNNAGESVSSGMYFYQLRTDTRSATKKLLLLK